LIFILFDLEATCWRHQALDREQEIIEIGALKLNRYAEVLGQFQSYVRPQLHPELSYFCQELTGIRQHQVEKSGLFDEVWDRFIDWIGAEGEDIILASWGAIDRVLLESSFTRYGLNTEWLEKCIDLKAQYKRIRGLKRQVGLLNALKREGEEFEGEHHNAMDDAKNLLPIFTNHLDEWIF
jgi:inhibitor of KinA sporulation pathway (predicted exonuclease)